MKLKKNPEQEGLFRISGDNEGVPCPFMASVCPGGYCLQCPIYLKWQKLEEILVVCAWCSEVIGRKPGHGKSGVSHGICPKCQRKYFPNTFGEKEDEA